MTINSEDELKQKLGLESWRNLSKDKFLTFVSDLPTMSQEVALKAIDQFPDLKSLVLDSLDQVHMQATNAVGVNWKSQKKVHKAFAEYREILSRELDREGLTTEDRFAILELLREAIEKEAAKDSEHKVFVHRMLATVATVAAVGLSVAFAALGGKAKLGGGD